MAADAPKSRQLAFTAEFKRNLRQLAKKYRHIDVDIQAIIDQLGAGETSGDQIPGVKYSVSKVRVKNSDARRGKSGGYRIIYWLKDDGHVVLVTLYSKTEQSDIAAKDIRRIITEFDRTSRRDGK